MDQSDDDATAVVVEQLSEAHPDRGRLLVRVPSADGMAAGQNVGFRHLRTSVVLVTDDDCVPDPGWVAVAGAAFAADPDLDLLTGRVLPLGPAAPDAVPVATRTDPTARPLDERTLPWDAGSGTNFALSRAAIDRWVATTFDSGRGRPSAAAPTWISSAACCSTAEVATSRSWWWSTNGRPAERFGRRIPYGFGMGVALALWWRQGDRRARLILGTWLRLRTRRLVTGLRRDRRLAAEEALVLAGTARGLLRGWSAEPGPMVTYTVDGTRRPPLTRRLVTAARNTIRPRRALSPLDQLQDAPSAVAALLDGRVTTSLPPSPRPKRHLLYQVGGGRRAARLRRRRRAGPAVDGGTARDLRSDPGHSRRVRPGRARGRAVAPGGTSVGHATDGRAARLVPEVADWLVEVAGPPGPPLLSTAFWSAHREDSLRAAPTALRDAVAAAWEGLAQVPARRLHGDAQPKNLVIGPDGPGLVDLEGSWSAGLPGARPRLPRAHERSPAPDPTVLRALAQGVDDPGRPLRASLEAVGLDETVLPSALLVMLATWNLGERRRATRHGVEERHRVGPFAAEATALQTSR